MALFNKSLKRKSGFTLIELLVVIAIIGLLASVILVSLNGARAKAKKAKAREELVQIIRAVQLGQIVLEQPMRLITGNGCSACGGSGATITSLQAISSKTGIPNLDKLRTDPWGGYYTFDENEGEFGSTDCRRDTIYASSQPDNSTLYNLEYQTAYCKANPVGTTGWQGSY